MKRNNDLRMNIPLHQKAYRWITYLLLGFCALGTFLDAVSKAVSLITPSRTYIFTPVIIAFWITIEIILRRYPKDWIVRGKQKVRIRGLGNKPRLAIIGALILLWLPRVTNHVTISDKEIEYLKNIRWTNQTVEYIKTHLNEKLEQAKSSTTKIEYIDFADLDDPLSTFWTFFSTSISEGNTDKIDALHATFRRLAILSYVETELSSSRELLQFYLFHRLKRLSPSHIKTGDDALLVRYLYALTCLCGTCPCEDCKDRVFRSDPSQVILQEVSREHRRIAQYLKDGNANERNIQWAYRTAIECYKSAASAFGDQEVFEDWNAILQLYDEIILSNIDEQFGNGRRVIDQRYDAIKDNIQKSTRDKVIAKMLKDLSSFALKSYDQGALFLTSWTVYGTISLLDSLSVKNCSQSKEMIMHHFLNHLRRALSDSKISLVKNNINTIEWDPPIMEPYMGVIETCRSFEDEQCDKLIQHFKDSLNAVDRKKFSDLQLLFFEDKNGFMLPLYPREKYPDMYFTKEPPENTK